MRTKKASPAALTGPFVSEATLRGIRAPIRLLGQGTHGWPVASRGQETLVVDEYGDLWWGRPQGTSDVRVLRACWPEEFRSMHPAIKRSLDLLLGEAASRPH